MEPAGVSGQHAYMSNVLLQNKPARRTNQRKAMFLFPLLFHHLPFAGWVVDGSLYLEETAHFLSFWHSLLYTEPTSDKSPLRLSRWPYHTVRPYQKIQHFTSTSVRICQTLHQKEQCFSVFFQNWPFAAWEAVSRPKTLCIVTCPSLPIL